MERRSKERIITLDVYTDGSLKRSGKTTFGGWGFIVTRDSKELYAMADSEANTTNQRMELKAIQKALEYVSSIRRNNEKIIIHSDSAYAVNCYLQEWYLNWENNGWLNFKKQPVANKDLWEQIVPYFDNFWYDFQKVEGHSGNYWNERCDEIAQTAAEQLRINWRGVKNE